MDYDLIEVNIFKGEGFAKKYRQIHPYSLLPALEANGQLRFLG